MVTVESRLSTRPMSTTTMMSRTTACRALTFGECVDHEQNRRDYEREMSNIYHKDTARWQLDFKMDTPPSRVNYVLDWRYRLFSETQRRFASIQTSKTNVIKTSTEDEHICDKQTSGESGEDKHDISNGTSTDSDSNSVELVSDSRGMSVSTSPCGGLNTTGRDTLPTCSKLNNKLTQSKISGKILSGQIF